MFLENVQKNKATQNGNCKSWLTLLFLLHDSRKFLWDVRVLGYPETFCGTSMSINRSLGERSDNCTSTIYVFLELQRCLYMKTNDSRRKFLYSSIFSEKRGGTEPANFRGVCMDDIAIVEVTFQMEFFPYDIDNVDGCMIGELARISVRKYSNTLRNLRYNSDNSYLSNINVLFKTYRCLCVIH